jgi:hypothetical protein
MQAMGVGMAEQKQIAPSGITLHRQTGRSLRVTLGLGDPLGEMLEKPNSDKQGITLSLVVENPPNFRLLDIEHRALSDARTMISVEIKRLEDEIAKADRERVRQG